jgi:hypothetical protein
MKKRSLNRWRIASLMLTVTATNGLNFAKNLSIAPVMKNLISAAVGKFCISIES